MAAHPDAPVEEVLRPLTEAAPFHEDQLDVYLARTRSGGPVYWALLGLVAIALLSLPRVRVPVAVHARGVLRPEAEPRVLFAASAGEVSWIRPAHARAIDAGDTVAILSRPELTIREETLRAWREELEGESRDLEQLIGWAEGGSPLPDPASLRYGSEAAAIRLDLESRAPRRAAAAGKAFVNEDPGDAGTAGVVARVAERHGGVDESHLLIARTTTRWRGELAGIRDALRVLMTEERVLAAEIERLVVRSPVSGTLDDVAPLVSGSRVSGGQRLATILPGSALVAELHADAGEIADVLRGSTARLRLDASGGAGRGERSGTVVEVFSELARVDGASVGTIRVRLDADSVREPSESAGFRRGAPVSARIPMGSRSLWTLLGSRAGRGDTSSPRPSLRPVPVDG
jgi:multidrug resistance efflux pump